MIFRLFYILFLLTVFFSDLIAADIKVLLKKSNYQTSLYLPRGYLLLNLTTNKVITTVNTDSKFVFSMIDGKIKISDVGVFTGPILIEQQQRNTFFRFNNRKYTGNLLLVLRNEYLWYINILDVEKYLEGVLPNEISPKWNLEVIKAQAIAARSFAYYIMKNNKNNLYDLTDSTFSQVYRGFGNESNVFNKAVKDTRNLVMVYRNEIVEAFFHSACGGHTESAEKVWGKKLPYLRGVTCNYCKNSPYYRWTAKFKKTEILTLLKKAGYFFSDIRAIVPARRSVSGRWIEVKIIGRKNRKIIQGNKFRIILGIRKLKSTKFRVRRYKDYFEFIGNGWGHGVGMCQWGAKTMAEKGYKYYQILRYYYRGVRIVDVSKLKF